MAISRFQIMATLQAARAKTLGLPEDSAYSWGLNRAIFYAAAKRGFKGGGSSGKIATRKTVEREKASKREESENEFYLGDEKAFVDEESSKKKPVFEIGAEPQTAVDFQKQVMSRFGDKSNFHQAWQEALEIMKKYDESTLKSQHDFFEEIYKPRRDVLSKKWTNQFAKKKMPAASRA
jgi:hypothetical protein